MFGTKPVFPHIRQCVYGNCRRKKSKNKKSYEPQLHSQTQGYGKRTEQIKKTVFRFTLSIFQNKTKRKKIRPDCNKKSKKSF